MSSRVKRERVAVALPEMESAPQRWLRNIRLSGFTLTVLGLVILAVIVLAPSLKLLVEQQQEIAQLRQAVVDKQNDVDALTKNVDRWRDPAYIEAQARQRLLFVYPGEISYLVIDDKKTTTTADGAPISDTIQTTQVDWVKSMLTSVLKAGLSSEAGNDLVSPVIEDGQ